MRRARVSVLFFGATAEAAGSRRVEIELDEGTSAGSVFDRILKDFPALSTHKLLFSVNETYAAGEEALRDGDELAIFTPVSGG